METKPIKILEKLTTQYSKFNKNQVLTEKQLNEFLDYFNDQDHLSRVTLSGVGIVCGFAVTIKENIIELTQGVGVTTDGDLLTLSNDLLDQVSSATNIYTHFRSFTDASVKYEPFFVDENQITLWELATEQIDETFSSLDSFPEELENKIALLYLENYEYESNLCDVSNCDNQGIKQIANLKLLLVSENDANLLLNSDTVYEKHNWFKIVKELPEIKPERIILNNSNSLSSIKNKYYDVIKKPGTIGNLVNGLEIIFNKFNKTLQTNDLNIFDFLKPATPDDFQYRYDVLVDLIATYNEVKDLLLNINIECSPEINSFSKHIFLGKLKENEEIPPYNNLRHRFYKSPILGHQEYNYKKVLNLLDRVSLIFANYNYLNEVEESTIKITPSTLYSSLGKKAIPYYYTVDNELLLAWNYDKTSNFKQEYNLSYHTENLASLVQKPLLYNFENDFYRIEGHLGLNAIESKNFINKLKRDNGLDFDCVLFDLNKQKKEFAQFLKDNPSLTHEAGVTKGGTFVLLSYNEEIKADFYINYKINVINDDQGCCEVKECSYPWISTLKYLNNLSRSLKGKQSNNHAMPKDYILHILDYKINGVPIITTQSTIRIPLTAIFLRRMHAITEALNNRFNNGVVFDFDDHQKRLIIISGKNDTYKIRITEETIMQNNDIYTYSNTGMKKNNIPFKYNAMICKDKITHSTSFYNKLHKKFAPINKDDDNHGYFDGKWEKWNILKENLKQHNFFTSKNIKRIINTLDDLPTKQRTLISNIKRELSNLNVDKPLMLDGDWVNENWVNEEMLTYYNEGKHTTIDDIEKDNIFNTHDDLILFINLRKNLHNESGVTKLSLYIEKPYDATFDSLINDHSNTVDFFFEKAKGPKAIVV